MPEWTKYFYGERGFEISKWVFDQLEIVDAHAHIGTDTDGTSLNLKGLIEELNAIGIRKAVVFPFNSDSFGKPNDQIYNAHKIYSDRIIPFFRLDPKQEWKKEFEKRIEQGFMGIKLHPRAQKFGIASSEAMEIYAKAERHNLPVLVHTGYGLNEISEDLGKVISSFPKLKIILGHAAFIDMNKVIEKMSKSKYVYFEISTISVFDLYNVLDKVNKNNIVFGSDTPYVASDYSLECLIHTSSILDMKMRDLGKILSWNLMKWFA